MPSRDWASAVVLAILFTAIGFVVPQLAPAVSASSSIVLDNVASNTGFSQYGSAAIYHSANATLIFEIGVDLNGCPGNFVTSLTVGGYPAHFWGRQSDAVCQSELEVWYLYRPAAGYDYSSFTISNACQSCEIWTVMVMSFTGVNSAMPFEHYPSAQTFQYGVGGTFQIYVPDTLPNRRVIMFTDIPGDHCSCSGFWPWQTQIDGQPRAPNIWSWIGASYSDSDGPATMSVSVYGSSAPWAGFADALVPVPVTAQITVTSSPATGSGYVTVDSSPIATPQTYTWNVGDSHTITALSPVSCGSGCQYVWGNWSDGGAQSHTITVPSTGITYEANFQRQYSLTVSAGSGGTTNPGPGTSWILAGQSATVSATPNSGYVFSGWTLDGGNVGNANPTSVTMNQPHNLVANFAQPGTLCPYVNTDPPGLVPQPTQTPSCPITPGTQVTITAQSIPDWKFENFTVSGVVFTQNSDSVTFTMPSSPVAVIARYSSVVVPPAGGIAIPAYNTTAVLLVSLFLLLSLALLAQRVARIKLVRCSAGSFM
jgi:hypothetical protein